MTAEEFKAAIVSLWGASWRKRAPTEFNVTVSTIDRWVTAEGRPNHADVHPCAERLLEHLVSARDLRAAQLARERAYRKRLRAAKKAARENNHEED